MIGIKEIAAYVAANENISKATAERIVGDTFGFIRDNLTTADEVNIHKFGKFTLAKRAARTGRNPATGEAIQIAEKTVVKFKPTLSFKTEIK